MTVALDRMLLAAAVVAVWAALSMAVGEFALASPWTTVTHLGALLASERYWGDIGETARAVGLAALISIGGGVVAGVVLGLNRYVGSVVEPLLVSLYSLPKITLYPVILLLFGLGLEAKVALGAIHGIVPVALFTLGGVRGVSPIHLAAARTMRLGRVDTVTRVVIPAALPEVVTGVRIGLALTLLGTLVGELFASQAGLGFVLKQSMSLADSETILAVAASVFAAAILFDRTFVALTRRWGGGERRGLRVTRA